MLTCVHTQHTHINTLNKHNVYLYKNYAAKHV